MLVGLYRNWCTEILGILPQQFPTGNNHTQDARALGSCYTVDRKVALLPCFRGKQGGEGLHAIFNAQAQTYSTIDGMQSYAHRPG